MACMTCFIEQYLDMDCGKTDGTASSSL